MLKEFEDNAAFREYLHLMLLPDMGDTEFEIHHILPESIFPEYSKCDWNLIKLSLENHYKAHELLPQFTTEQHRKSMLYAWNMMRGRYKGDIIDSAKYSDNRIAHKKLVSEQFSGDKNHMKLEENKAKFRHPRPEHSVLMSGASNPSKRPEVRKILSEHNPMKLEENKEKFRGKNNPNFGKQLSVAQKAKISKAQTGRVHSESEKEKRRQYMLANPVGNKLTIIDGIEYPSRAEAARVIGVNRKTVEKWAKFGKPTDEEKRKHRSDSHKGYVWTEEARNKLSNTISGNSYAKKTPIEIDGVQYKSIAFAADELEVNREVIKRMIKSGEAIKLPKDNK